ncbi:MAG: tetratricopeptide (TPR) repeat protein/ribosomal protein L37AE/L43A [Candidatus Azotimanducaceae bacterium]|jgi:tetratricopeptide (TPR) repeat protein/ribosomal protein L37AE/L43A
MADTFNLIFFPTTNPGEDEAKVKEKLKQTLKIDDKKINTWYAAGAPTVLLKDVAHDVADRYLQAIKKCGANCNIQPSTGEKDNLSLVPKKARTDYFVCPSCEYDEEISVGQEVEKCPKCGLVIAKWAEKQIEEREKEEIRRRLLRQARLTDEGDEQFQRQKDELERLRKLEREIMAELGIKPPGKFWTFFEQHPFFVGVTFTLVILVSTVLGMSYFNNMLVAEEQAIVAASEPSADMVEVAPVLAAAVQLKQTGNEVMVEEMAGVSQMMRGGSDSQQAIVEAAKNMMKGADAATFINNAANTAGLANAYTKVGEMENQSLPVNLETIGGISGLNGVDNFMPDDLEQILPAQMESGHDALVDVLKDRRRVSNPADPSGPLLLVDRIEKMDASEVVTMMKGLSEDREWDMYLLQGVNGHLRYQDVSKAENLSSRIKDPIVRIKALVAIMVKMSEINSSADLRALMGQMDQVSLGIKDLDVRAGLVQLLGESLTTAGHADQPFQTISRMEKVISEANDAYTRAIYHSRLALLHLAVLDKQAAQKSFKKAERSAAEVSRQVDRLSAFTSIAQHYYDARNTPLANQILREAQRIAATELTTRDRGRVFSKIAIAQSHLGDIEGAMQSVSNAGAGEGRNQLLKLLADVQLDSDNVYSALIFMDALEGTDAFHELQTRLITSLIYQGKERQAKAFLSQAIVQAKNITDASRSGLHLSRYARLYQRVGDDQRAEESFSDATNLSSRLVGRRADVNYAVVSVNQARALMLPASRTTMAKISETFVRESIESEFMVVQRIVRNLPPE